MNLAKDALTAPPEGAGQHIGCPTATNSVVPEGTRNSRSSWPNGGALYNYTVRSNEKELPAWGSPENREYEEDGQGQGNHGEAGRKLSTSSSERVECMLATRKNREPLSAQKR